MEEKQSNIPALVKQFKRLSIADLAFMQANELAKHMIAEQLAPLSLLFSPQMAGIVVTYAKNFVSALGIGPLHQSYSGFVDEDMQATHDRLLQSRHALYAHRDVKASKTFDYDDDSIAESYDVRIRIGRGFFSVNLLK